MALVPVLCAMGEAEHDAKSADAADAAAAIAESRRRIGGALRVRGLLEGGKRRLELLREAAETLASSPALLWRAEAYVDLGAAMRVDGQAVSAREILRVGTGAGAPVRGNTVSRPR